ncbi:polysaccharide biosynthesis tyrosine autokinase [Flavobacterium sp. ASW18X]|uniref:GumC family protein n=1 Tax=Flavobacterium sp. ASW18X TaxID=2572595 RepID=UPI001F0CE741|nr:polysaccharide biosynthesis tyrosine autokinase [Flavobacterium sp. ASW18X]
MQVAPSTSNATNGIKETVKYYLKYKYWFLLSLVMAVTIAYFFVSYSTPKYQANATIQVVEDDGAASQLSFFSDLGIMPGGGHNVEDEIEVLRSRSNFIAVVKALNLNKRIYHVGSVKSSEIYKNVPITFSFVSKDSLANDAKFTAVITPKSETNLTLLIEENGEEVQKKALFGKEIDTEEGKITFLPGNAKIFKKFIGQKLRVELVPISDAALQYQKSFKAATIDKFSSVINLSIQDPVKQKAEDILNSLIKTYNFNGRDDKKKIADRTAAFIDDRIAEIYGDLSDADKSAEEFKAGRGLTDIASQSNINLNVSAANQQELQDAQTQLQIAGSVSDLLEGNNEFGILPSNIGLTDPSITNTTARYNQLVLERERLLKSSNEKNPVIVNIDEQLESLKTSMKSSLNSMQNNLSLRVNNLSSQLATINSKIYSAPKNERALREITRKQQTVEGLYLYLLQKREEAQIAYASAAPNSKVIDTAYPASKYAVSPKKSIIYLASLILGFMLPIGVLYALDILDDKIHSAESLEKLIEGGVIVGELPKLKKKENKIIGSGDRSVISEALRIIRTNIDYLLKKNSGAEDKKNVVFVTSNLPQEGKTFFSTNLSFILSNTGKKILLIGADIRNPKFHEFLEEAQGATPGANFRDQIGLTDYLYNSKKSIGEITNKVVIHGNAIDVIASGKLYPNPSELLLSERFGDLITKASESYDYVIVDTAPTMPVTDTLLISANADVVVYVTRAGKTKIDDMAYPIKLKKEGKLNNLAFVVNGVKNSELGYGGKYGYGYGEPIGKFSFLNLFKRK